MKRTSRAARGGFTLIELLIVTMIIGILMSIIISAAVQVRRYARELAIYNELMELHSAIEMYKQRYGGYPPNLTATQNEIDRHLRKAFPRMRSDQQGIQRGGDAAEALVVWLSGYGPNPRNPFAENAKRDPLYAFDETRLRRENGKVRYYPRDVNEPFVYFHHASYNQIEFQSTTGEGGKLLPYTRDLNEGETDQGGTSGENSDRKYVNPDTFQIISAGLDNDYGNGGSYPSGKGYQLGDRDNITNFCDRMALRNRMQ